MARRAPRSVIVAAGLAAVVAAGALGGAAALRWRAAESAAMAATSTKPPAAGEVGVSGCLIEPCTVVPHTPIGGTAVELVVDAGGRSGRLRIGGVTSGQVIAITDLGVTFTPDSLRCVAGGLSACLVSGERDGHIVSQVVGQVVVGRSDRWSAVAKPYLSTAGHLGLANIDGDSAPEILAAQHACRGTERDCSGRPVFIQVFAINGTVVGCTRNYARLDRIPGYPAVQVTKAQLTACG